MHRLRGTAACISASISLAAAPAFAQDDPIAKAKAEAELATDMAKAAEATAKARQAEYEAQEAATRAKFGPLAEVSREGSVEAGTHAGKLEAQVLAADAMRDAANVVVTKLKTRREVRDNNCKGVTNAAHRANLGCDVERPTIILFTDAEKQNFEAYDAFVIQIGDIDAGLEAAIQLASQPAPKPSRGTSVSTSALGIAGAATILSVAGNLFRSDYKVEGMDLAATNDSLFAKAIIERGLEQRVQYSLHLGIMMLRPVGSVSKNEARMLMDNAALKRSSLAAEVEKLRPDKNRAAVVAKMDSALKRFDDFATKLATPDASGQVSFVAITRQADINKRLRDKGSMMLFVKADYSGGSTYTQKNFFTFFGGVPFYISGGALTSFTLLDGSSGDILEAGVVDNITPFRRIRDIRARH